MPTICPIETRLYRIPVVFYLLFICFRPNGQAEIKIDIPSKSTQTFAIGGFALHPTEGLTVVPDYILVRLQLRFSNISDKHLLI